MKPAHSDQLKTVDNVARSEQRSGTGAVVEHPTRSRVRSGALPLKVKIFSDGADRETMLALARDSNVSGLTTNPTLMKKAGIKDYKSFCHDILSQITDKPISFEVFADDFAEMERQAFEIATWGDNVYVKIPVTNSLGLPSYELINKLARHGVKLNVTAILTLEQVMSTCDALRHGPASVVSVFAGRIADTGVDPVPLMTAALEICRCVSPKSELLWASPREVLNIVQADQIGCDIITITSDLFKKLPMLGRDLADLSLDTVKMFKNDAESAGFTL